MKIKFLKSPTGVFNLGYFPGDVCDMDDERAKLLVEGKFAEVESPVKDEPEVEKVKRGRKSK